MIYLLSEICKLSIIIFLAWIGLFSSAQCRSAMDSPNLLPYNKPACSVVK
jgi:hypothetical protein